MADLQYRQVGWRPCLESTWKHQSHVSVVCLVGLAVTLECHLPIGVIEYGLSVTLIILPNLIIFLSPPFITRHQSHWTVVILNNGLVERLPDFRSCWMAKYWLHLTAVDKQKCTVAVPRTKLGSRHKGQSTHNGCVLKMNICTGVCVNGMNKLFFKQTLTGSHFVDAKR